MNASTTVKELGDWRTLTMVQRYAHLPRIRAAGEGAREGIDP
jgi:hypothetical protein